MIRVVAGAIRVDQWEITIERWWEFASKGEEFRASRLHQLGRDGGSGATPWEAIAWLIDCWYRREVLGLPHNPCRPASLIVVESSSPAPSAMLPIEATPCAPAEPHSAIDPDPVVPKVSAASRRAAARRASR